MSKPKLPSGRRVNLVAFAFALVITGLLVLLLGRVAQLQLAPGADLSKLLMPRVTTRTELPMRGDLTDRRGRLLSATRFGFRVVVDPTLLPDLVDSIIAPLADAIGETPDKVGAKIIWAAEENLRRKAQLDSEAVATATPNSAGEYFAKLIDTVRRRVGRDEKFLSEAALANAIDPDDEPDDEPARVEPGSDAAGVASDTLTNTASNAAPKKKGLIRYLPLGPVLDEDRADAVRALRIVNKKGKKISIPGLIIERRAVREYPGGPDAASLAGKVDWAGAGMVGIESRLNGKLTGEVGKVSFVRDAAGRPLWMEPGQVRPARAGEDVRLSIDLELQRMAVEELERGVDDANAAGGRLVMLDPISGEILAMVDLVRQLPDAVEFPWRLKAQKPDGNESPTAANRPGGQRFITIHENAGKSKVPGLARNRCIEDIYEPGSTFKPFVWATITELGLAKPDEVFDTEGGSWITPDRRYIQDVHRAPTMTWSQVLVNSSNIGMIKAAQRLTYAQLHDAVARFGFGKPTGILQLTPTAGLGGEARGLITSMKNWKKGSQVSVAFGHEVAVTPVQVVRAFSAFARSGPAAGTLPAIRLTAADPQTGTPMLYRVLPANIAELTRRTMQDVATKMEAKMVKDEKPVEGWRYQIFGKSGTAEIPLGKAPPGFRRPKGTTGYFDGQYNSSFVAGGPVEQPRLVILVVIDDPGPDLVRTKKHYGALVAGPVVRRVMERALTYLGVPPSLLPAPAPTVAQATANENLGKPSPAR